MVTKYLASRHPLLQGTAFPGFIWGKQPPRRIVNESLYRWGLAAACQSGTWLIRYLAVKCRYCFVPACLQAVGPAMTWWRGGLHPSAIAGTRQPTRANQEVMGYVVNNLPEASWF